MKGERPCRRAVLLIKVICNKLPRWLSIHIGRHPDTKSKTTHTYWSVF